jgi:hypothetical protein
LQSGLSCLLLEDGQIIYAPALIGKHGGHIVLALAIVGLTLSRIAPTHQNDQENKTFEKLLYAKRSQYMTLITLITK